MQIRGQHLIAAEDTHTRMSRLATQEFYFGRQLRSREVLAQIQAIDGQTLQRISGEDLIDAMRRATIAIVGPEMPQQYDVQAVEELLTGFQCAT